MRNSVKIKMKEAEQKFNRELAGIYECELTPYVSTTAHLIIREYANGPVIYDKIKNASDLMTMMEELIVFYQEIDREQFGGE